MSLFAGMCVSTCSFRSLICADYSCETFTTASYIKRLFSIFNMFISLLELFIAISTFSGSLRTVSKASGPTFKRNDKTQSLNVSFISLMVFKKSLALFFVARHEINRYPCASRLNNLSKSSTVCVGSRFVFMNIFCA